MTKLAIIDDDQEILTLLDEYLAKNGFEVEGLADGETFLSRDKISELLHRRRIEPFDRSIDTSVSRLRHKLSDHLEGEIIQSVRGKGYVFLLKK